MPYIGKQPLTGAYQLCDAITTSATATYNLTVGGSPVIPGSAQNCIVSLNGVVQAPVNAFTVSGSQITFASALTSSDVIDFIVILGNVFDIGKPTDGSVTNASIANGTINLTTKVTGVLPVANGGTNLSSGFANGITEADMWRITTNTTINTTNTDLTSNWERADTDGFEKIGTGMSQSSGIFTFPSTGIYLIEFNVHYRQTTNDANYVTSAILTTLDNSSYSIATASNSASRVNDYNTNTLQFIFNVSSTTNRKCKFQMTAQVVTVTAFGETNENSTYVTFIRLGDSV